MSRRPTARTRLKKAKKRKKRLRWWRSKGGNAAEAGRGGIVPSVYYAARATGVTAAMLRDTRRILVATSRIQASGSSTTARLALGGNNFDDIDPGVIHPNPPLVALAQAWWDEPQSRSDHVRTWSSAKQRLDGISLARAWRMVRGPVDAALLHLLQIGASWPRPFVVLLLDRQVDLLKIPPLVVLRILRLHARRHYDHVLLGRLADRHGWQHDTILRRYALGIDWDIIRSVRIGKSNSLSKSERAMLQVVVCGAIWTEERRWREGGMLPTGTCLSCMGAMGSMFHKCSGDCGAIQQEIQWARMTGRTIPGPDLDIALRPLLEYGLPPPDLRPPPRGHLV